MLEIDVDRELRHRADALIIMVTHACAVGRVIAT